MLFALGAVVVVSVAGLVWRLGRRSGTSSFGTEAASVSRELTRLDPFGFFVVPGHEFGLDHVVVGTTGAFAIQVGHATVDGRFRRDVKRARKGAARVRRGAGQTAVHTRVRPVVCLPGRQFAPKTARGVRVIPWGSVVAEIAARNRSVTTHQARRIAEALGGAPWDRYTRESV